MLSSIYFTINMAESKIVNLRQSWLVSQRITLFNHVCM